MAVKGVKPVLKKLKRVQTKSTSAARIATVEIVNDILVRANALAPVLTGDLINSARGKTRGGPVKGYDGQVGYGTGHAVFAHEQITPAGPRQLGPFSKIKNQTMRSEDGPVGGHFLRRVFVLHTADYVRHLKNVMAKEGGFRPGAAPKLGGRISGRFVRGGAR